MRKSKIKLLINNCLRGTIGEFRIENGECKIKTLLIFWIWLLLSKGKDGFAQYIRITN